MADLLSILMVGLSPDLRVSALRRVDVMKRELVYLFEQGDLKIFEILKSNWSMDELFAVCALNSFYQIVLAPLAS
ncbi:MAG TPA: hypothetical protein VGE98_12490, partial [Thermoanaerobaculia bacterium]